MVKFRPPLTWIHLYIWWMSIWTFACTSPFTLHYMSVHRHFILLPCHTSLLLVCGLQIHLFSTTTSDVLKTNILYYCFQRNSIFFVQFQTISFLYCKSPLFHFSCFMVHGPKLWPRLCFPQNKRAAPMTLKSLLHMLQTKAHHVSSARNFSSPPSLSASSLHKQNYVGVEYLDNSTSKYDPSQCEVRVQALRAVCVECRCLSSHYSQQISCWVK